MIRISNAKLFAWSNRFCNHPVAVAEILEWETGNWDFSKVPLEVRNVLANRFCSTAVPEDNLTVDQFLVWTIHAIQQFWDVTPLIADRVDDTETGKSHLYCAYGDEGIAELMLRTAVDTANLMLSRKGRKAFSVRTELANLVRILDRQALGLTMRAVLRSAVDRNIAWKRTPSTGNYAILGQGRNRRLVQGPVTDRAGFVGATFAKDKFQSLLMLRAIGLPVGKVALARDVESAANAATRIGYPVALKAVDVDLGQLVWARLETETDARRAADKLRELGRLMLVQSHFPGDDHRILIVDHKFVAAARRTPASVFGDGKHSISELIEIENDNPMRGENHFRLMNVIDIDDKLYEYLRSQDLDIDDVPEPDRRIQLRRTANISTGGTAEDVTTLIHPDNIRMAETASRQLSLEVAAIDFITPDITRSWKERDGGICEVNATPGMRPHWNANPEHDVTTPILDLMFPNEQCARIPIAMITGTNGKTTTTLMLKSILTQAGHVVGASTTDGAIVGPDLLQPGDIAGISGANFILQHPDVTAAVLETARGGLIKRGIAVPECDVAALLNIQREQIEIDGIETLDDMLDLKRKVTDIASKAVVLNADDPRTRKLIFSYPADRVIVFTLNKDPATARELANADIRYLTVDGGRPDETIVYVAGGRSTAIVEVREIPTTMNGAHRGDVANAMAAAALAIGIGIKPATIAEGLKNHMPTRPREPGRMIWIEGYPFRILVDYASNASSFEVVVEALNSFAVEGKRICVFTAMGNRPDWSFDESAAAVARGFDHFICFARPDRLRGRNSGDISKRLQAGLIKAGVDEDRIDNIADADEAMKKAVEMVRPGDLFCLMGGPSGFLLDMLERGLGPLDGTAHSVSEINGT